jgi:hypothetical protein
MHVDAFADTLSDAGNFDLCAAGAFPPPPPLREFRSLLTVSPAGFLLTRCPNGVV